MKKLKNKICLITGGTGLIGQEIIKEFLNHGAIVVFTFNSNFNKAKNLCKNNKNLFSYKLDIKKSSIKKLYNFIEKKFKN